MTVNLKRIHHVAYRCKDAKETVEFYQRVLNMDFVLAIAEDQVPSTKAPDPYMHIFMDAGMGTATDAQMKQLHEVAPAMIEEWSRTKRAPNHAAWLHEQD